MAARNQRLREYMSGQGIDAALFTSIHNVNYFADFVYTSFGRNYGLVVTEKTHVTISANVDFGQPYRQSFGDNIAYTDWHKDNFFEAVKTLVPNRGRVGIEFDHVTIQNRKKLGDALPAVEFVEIGVTTMAMRMIKTEGVQDIAPNGAAVCHYGGAPPR